MSSYVSTVTIDDAEWAELQRCVADTNTYVARQREKARRIQEEADRREQALIQLQAQLTSQAEIAANSLTATFNRSLENLARTAHSDSKLQSEAFETGVAELREQIESTREKTVAASQKIGHLSDEYTRLISELVSRSSGAKAKARAYLESIRQLSQQISTLDPSIFEPNKYAEVMQLITSTEANLNSGSYEAALITVQNGTAKASRLLVELIADQDIFEKELVDVTGHANALKTRFDLLSPEMQGAISFDLDGEEIEYEYDINHWSEGRFEELRIRFNRCFEQVEAVGRKKGSVKLLESLRIELAEIDALLTKCDVSARQELLGSLKAQEISARLCDSLMDNNWSLEKHGFEQADDRNPYTMTYKDGAGNSISIIVSPSASAEKPTIFLEAFTEEDAHADIIKKNVHSTLAEEGIAIEQTKQLSDCQTHADGDAFVRHTVTRAKEVNRQRRQKSFL